MRVDRLETKRLTVGESFCRPGRFTKADARRVAAIGRVKKSWENFWGGKSRETAQCSVEFDGR